MEYGKDPALNPTVTGRIDDFALLMQKYEGRQVAVYLDNSAVVRGTAHFLTDGEGSKWVEVAFTEKHGYKRSVLCNMEKIVSMTVSVE